MADLSQFADHKFNLVGSGALLVGTVLAALAFFSSFGAIAITVLAYASLTLLIAGAIFLCLHNLGLINFYDKELRKLDADLAPLRHAATELQDSALETGMAVNAAMADLEALKTERTARNQNSRAVAPQPIAFSEAWLEARGVTQPTAQPQAPPSEPTPAPEHPHLIATPQL